MKERISKLPQWAQEHIYQLTERALRAGADLHDEPTPERDLQPPIYGSGNALIKGWDYNCFRGLGAGVFKACSNSVHHGEGWERTTSQGKRALFSTELMALQAMRAEFVSKHRSNIAALDERIETLKPTS